MPVLPIDYPDAFAATLGVMLYPGISGDDPSKARAFAAQFSAKAVDELLKRGGIVSGDDLARLLIDAGHPLDDIPRRWWAGLATGQTLKSFIALANADPKLASWNNASRTVEKVLRQSRAKGTR